ACSGGSLAGESLARRSMTRLQHDLWKELFITFLNASLHNNLSILTCLKIHKNEMAEYGVRSRITVILDVVLWKNIDKTRTMPFADILKRQALILSSPMFHLL
ncbi:hypothetical protein L9F63_015973, partial [Diploptera punctata]